MSTMPDNGTGRETWAIDIRPSVSPAPAHSDAALSNRIRELEGALRDRDEFLAVLAHELRNPLAPIRNVAEIVRACADSDERLRKLGDILERQVAQMSRLVDDLFDTARMRWGRLTLAREVVDVATVLSGAVETMKPRFVSRSLALSLTIRHEALPANADPTRLTQIFCNLLDNAAKYTPDGGRIEIEVRRDGNHALVRVEDSGIGIPDRMLTAIFEPFTQVKSASEQARGGLGLGLPIVKKLVEMHGGSVEARSDGPGRGAEFVVKLPLTGVEASEKKAISAMSNRRTQSVLVVDDDRDTCDTLGMMLEHLGCKVELAHDVDHALETAMRGRPDLILLDIGLPKVDGYEIVRRLRDRADLSATRIAALTGYAGSEDRRRGEEAGFDTYLVKPVNFDALTRLLDEPRA